MAKRPNLKIDVSADTSKLQSGMKDSKAAVKDFESVSDGALGKIGELFGVDTAAVQKLANATRGLGVKMQQSGNAGAAAFGKIVTGAGAAGAAVAAVGIGAAVAGFKLLSEEAEAFKNTVAGANIELKTAAYVSTYKQVLHDFNSATGEWAANAGADIEKGFKSTWAKVKSIALKTFADIKNGSFFLSGGLVNSVLSNSLETSAQGGVAEDKANKAAELADKMFQIQRKISDKSVEWARIEAQIADYRRIAYDKSVGVTERAEALEKVQQLVTKRYQEQADLENELARLQEEMNGLAESSIEDVDKANNLKKQAFATETRLANMRRELLEIEKQINDELKKQDQIKKSREELASLDLSVSTIELPNKVEYTGPGIKVPVVPEVQTETLVAELQVIQDTMIAGVESMAEAFGGLFGDLVTGGAAFENFGNVALKSMAQLAVQVGKLAIGTGIASLGIKEAMKLNPYLAIAAGAALVALGTAVAVGLNNIASGAGGGYVASSGVAQSSYGPQEEHDVLGKQSMNIEVTGTLKASGNQLVAVINNENNRTNRTT